MHKESLIGTGFIAVTVIKKDGSKATQFVSSNKITRIQPISRGGCILAFDSNNNSFESVIRISESAMDVVLAIKCSDNTYSYSDYVSYGGLPEMMIPEIKL